MKKKQPNKVIIGLCSGGFAPLHKGHLHYLQEAAKNCDYLIVAVNDDEFLRKKHGYVFMEQSERCEILNALDCVDKAFVFSPKRKGDMTVKDALKKIKPDIFFKGGDRLDKDTIPEWSLCKRLGIEIKIAGNKKENSSTTILTDFKNSVN